MLTCSGRTLVIILIVVVLIMIALLMAIVVPTVLLIWIGGIGIVVATAMCEMLVKFKARCRDYSRLIVVTASAMGLSVILVLATMLLMGIILVLVVVALVLIVLIVRIGSLGMMPIAIVVMASLWMTRHSDDMLIALRSTATSQQVDHRQ